MELPPVGIYEEKLSTDIIHTVSPQCQLICVTLEFPLDSLGTDLQLVKLTQLFQQGFG